MACRAAGASGRATTAASTTIATSSAPAAGPLVVVVEAPVVAAPLAERVLPKQRILELYLNVIEWGPGVYGADAAARSWYGIPAAKVNREQAARLAAVIPSPLRRRPARMNGYSAEILHRMEQTGW